MIIPDKLYNILKWVLMIVIPACEAFLTALTMAWGWDIPLEAIIATMTATQAFVGALVGISSKNYKTKQKPTV